MRGFLFVAFKDLKLELRTRYLGSIVLLFTLISTTILNFSIPSHLVTELVFTGMLWTVMFFASMTGMARSFVSEEEKGTSLLLRLISTSISVFLGKFIFNIIFSFFINLASVLFFIVFFDRIQIQFPGYFLLIIIVASFGIATSSTIIGAIIARAPVKGALFPIMSVPILIPLLMIGIDATYYSIVGKEMQTILQDILLMFSYSGLLLVVSSIIFDFVWSE